MNYTNDQLTDLVKDAPIDSGVKAALLSLLDTAANPQPVTSILIRNPFTGATGSTPQPKDAIIGFTNENQLSVTIPTGDDLNPVQVIGLVTLEF